ncbi:hypothetical protein GCM10020255_036890 [Rhodococcus baikonurensis]
MSGEPVPLSVYRMASGDLVKEYRSLYRRCDRLTPREKARFYFVNEEMRARGSGMAFQLRIRTRVSMPGTGRSEI